jgi:hypothetical protein
MSFFICFVALIGTVALVMSVDSLLASAEGHGLSGREEQRVGLSSEKVVDIIIIT